jgi:hypothetical protein
MVSDDAAIPHVRHLYKYKTVRQFEDDMDFVLKHYFPISLTDLLSSLRSGRPLRERSFLLTFDDGYREMSEIVAPILMKKGISATFFLNSAFIDNKQMCYVNKASLLVEQLPTPGSSGLEKELSAMLRSNMESYQSDTRSKAFLTN